MKQKRNKIRYIVLMLSFCCLLVTGTYKTYAYFSDKELLNNQFTLGRNRSVIEEEFPDPDPLIPNEQKKYQKEVKVKNLETMPVYVRMLVVCSDSILTDSVSYQGLNQKNWVSEGEYYYYTQPLAPGEETEALFEGVVICLPENQKLAEGEELTIFCYEETIQDRHGSKRFEDYKEAWKFYCGGDTL